MIWRAGVLVGILLLFSSSPAKGAWYGELDTNGQLDDPVDYVQVPGYTPVSIDVWVFGEEPIRSFRLDIVDWHSSTGFYEGCVYYTPDGWEDVTPLAEDTVVLASSLPPELTGVPFWRPPSWSSMKTLFKGTSTTTRKSAENPPAIVLPYRVATVEYSSYFSSMTEVFIVSGHWVSADGDSGVFPSTEASDRIVVLDTNSWPLTGGIPEEVPKPLEQLLPGRRNRPNSERK